MTRTKHSKQQQSRGFALLMALLVLGISATALGLLSQRRLQRVLTTEQSAEDLQTRWTERSLADTLLPQAQAWLHEVNMQQPGTPSITLNLEFNGQKISARIDNEHAKISPAVLAQRLDPIDYQAAMTELIGPNARDLIDPVLLKQTKDALDHSSDTTSITKRPPVRLNNRRPANIDEEPATQRAQTLPWSQIFAPNKLNAKTLWAVSPSLTIYTDGQIDLKQANPSIIRAIASPPLNAAEIARLLEEREARPDADAFSLIYAVADTPDNDGVRKAQQLFTKQSVVHSLWLQIGTGASAKRSYAVLVPQEENESRQPTTNTLNRLQSINSQGNTQPTQTGTQTEHRILRQSL